MNEKLSPKLEKILEEIKGIKNASKRNREKYTKLLRTWAIVGQRKEDDKFAYQFIPDNEPVVDCFSLLIDDYQGTVVVYHAGTEKYSAQNVSNSDIENLKKTVVQAESEIELALKPTFKNMKLKK